MATQKIKKKPTNAKASFVPRQGAIPCLVILLVALVVLALFFFGALHNLG